MQDTIFIREYVRLERPIPFIWLSYKIEHTKDGPEITFTIKQKENETI